MIRGSTTTTNNNQKQTLLIYKKFSFCVHYVHSMYRTLIYLEGLAIYPVMNVQAVLIAKTGQLITDSQLAV